MVQMIKMKGERPPGQDSRPPPDYYDPDEKLPRLPMPYRMIDNLLRDLIEEALEQAREDPPREEPLVPILPSFSLDIPDIVAVQPAKDGLIIFIGCRDGKLLCVNSLRGELVGEPIDLEDTIKCMTLAADGRLLAVAVGGAAGEEGADAKPSTVKLMLVQPDKPFLKTATSTTLAGEAAALSFSFDSCVFAVLLTTNQLECFRTTITAPHQHEADVEPASPQVKAEAAGPPEGGEGAGEEQAQEQQLVTEPVRVLLTPPRPSPSTSARTVVMLGKSPKVRQVGELEADHCAHVNMVTLGSHFVEKFRVSESALPPPGDDAPAPVEKAETVLRLPHAVSAVAIDASTAMLFTGMLVRAKSRKPCRRKEPCKTNLSYSKETY